LIIEGYKEVLRRNLSVRGAEELARRMKSRHNIAPKKGANTEVMRIVSEDIDRVEQVLTKVLSNGQKVPKIKYILTGTTARLEIRLDGNPEETSEKIQKITRAISESGYFVNTEQT